MLGVLIFSTFFKKSFSSNTHQNKNPCSTKDKQYVYSIAAFLNGRFQKISIPNHGQLLGFPKGRRVHDYGILRAWGVFTIGNPMAWGDFTGGISGVENVE